MFRWLAIFLLIAGSLAAADDLTIRVVAANLTSGTRQSYSVDNSNHSNIEGAGARILKGLQPDIVLIQEFSTGMPRRQWVNQTLGEEFQFMVEEGDEIPNGIISRFPILESGEWDDTVVPNRDFAWARIALPDGSRALVVSVHLFARKASGRVDQCRTLAKLIAENRRAGERVIFGGDLNTRHEDESCIAELTGVLHIPDSLPADILGNTGTNGPRKAPYDWVLVDSETNAKEIPVTIGGTSYEGGLVFDSRIFEPLEAVAPVQIGDSGVQGMQHMAVVRDFQLKK